MALFRFVKVRAPSASGGVNSIANTSGTSNTLATTISPTSGDVLVRFVFRNYAATKPALTVVVGAVTMTQLAYDCTAAIGGAGAWIGYARGVPTGSPLSVVVTSDVSIGKLCGRISNLIAWSGRVGRSATALYTGVTTLTGPVATASLIGSGGAIAGIAGCSDKGANPILASGWAADSVTTVGTTAPTACAGLFSQGPIGSVNPGGLASGTSVSLSPTSAVGWTDWATAWAELL